MRAIKRFKEAWYGLQAWWCGPRFTLVWRDGQLFVMQRQNGRINCIATFAHPVSVQNVAEGLKDIHQASVHLLFQTRQEVCAAAERLWGLRPAWRPQAASLTCTHTLWRGWGWYPLVLRCALPLEARLLCRRLLALGVLQSLGNLTAASISFYRNCLRQKGLGKRGAAMLCHVSADSMLFVLFVRGHPLAVRRQEASGDVTTCLRTLKTTALYMLKEARIDLETKLCLLSERADLFQALRTGEGLRNHDKNDIAHDPLGRKDFVLLGGVMSAENVVCDMVRMTSGVLWRRPWLWHKRWRTTLKLPRGLWWRDVLQQTSALGLSVFVVWGGLCFWPSLPVASKPRAGVMGEAAVPSKALLTLAPLLQRARFRLHRADWQSQKGRHVCMTLQLHCKDDGHAMKARVTHLVQRVRRAMSRATVDVLVCQAESGQAVLQVVVPS